MSASMARGHRHVVRARPVAAPTSAASVSGPRPTRPAASGRRRRPPPCPDLGRGRRAAWRSHRRRSAARTSRRARRAQARGAAPGRSASASQRVGERTDVVERDEHPGLAGTDDLGDAATGVDTSGSPAAPASDRTIGRQSPFVGRQNMSAWWNSWISSALFGVRPWWTVDAGLGATVAPVAMSSRTSRPCSTPDGRAGAKASRSTGRPCGRGRRRRTGCARARHCRAALRRALPHRRQHAGRDDGDLVGIDAVAVDEPGLRPLGPRHDVGGALEHVLLARHFNFSTRPTPVLVPVVLAQLVVLDRRRVERDHRRQPPDPSGVRTAGTCVWMKSASSGRTRSSPAHGLAGPDAGAHRPVRPNTGIVAPCRRRRSPPISSASMWASGEEPARLSAWVMWPSVRSSTKPICGPSPPPPCRQARPSIRRRTPSGRSSPELVGHAAVVGEAYSRSGQAGHRSHPAALRPGDQLQVPTFTARRCGRGAQIRAAGAPAGGGRGTRWRWIFSHQRRVQITTEDDIVGPYCRALSSHDSKCARRSGRRRRPRRREAEARVPPSGRRARRPRPAGSLVEASGGDEVVAGIDALLYRTAVPTLPTRRAPSLRTAVEHVLLPLDPRDRSRPRGPHRPDHDSVVALAGRVVSRWAPRRSGAGTHVVVEEHDEGAVAIATPRLRAAAGPAFSCRAWRRSARRQRAHVGVGAVGRAVRDDDHLGALLGQPRLRIEAVEHPLSRSTRL